MDCQASRMVLSSINSWRNCYDPDPDFMLNPDQDHIPMGKKAVWRIRDVYPGSDFFPSRIRTVSIQDPGSSSKNLSILTPPPKKKWFLSSKKYDPGCSSRIPDPDADFLPSRIPDPGVKKAPNPGSRIRIRNTGKKPISFTLIFHNPQ
jgi:hypothetical protein